MDVSHQRPTGLTRTRLVLVVAVAVAMVLGYVGFAQYLTRPEGNSLVTYLLDVLYADLQLFVLSAPLDGGPYPFALQVARFLAPVATIFALVEAGRALLVTVQTRKLRGHAIVTGDGPIAQALTASIRADGTRVVRLAAPEATDPRLLRDAGISGAAVLYACAEDERDGAANVATALAAATRAHPLLKVYAHVNDATLALALRARRLGLVGGNRLHVDFFNVDELAARELVRVEDFDIEPRVLIVGLGPFGRALLVELASAWRLRSPRRGDKLSVTLLDPDAPAIAAELRTRWDVVNEVCELHPAQVSLAEHVAAPGWQPPARAYLCQDDEEVALRSALSAHPLWHGGPNSLVVRLNRLSRHRGAFRGAAAGALDPGLLDDLGGRLRPVGVTELACVPVVISEDLVERLARAIHEQYLLEGLRDGATMGSGALVAWDELPERFRSANRHQAGDIGPKLALIGCTVAPRTGSTGGFEFGTGEIERLAIHEHDRWMAERTAAGWKYGAPRDDSKKRHPSLVEWPQLSESERDKDRDAVRNLPAVLASVGLRIVRLAGP